MHARFGARPTVKVYFTDLDVVDPMIYIKK